MYCLEISLGDLMFSLFRIYQPTEIKQLFKRLFHIQVKRK